MSSFPLELVVDILSWIAPEDLIQCMRVCKAWNAFIRGENFIKSHLQRFIQTNSTRCILLTSSDSVLFSEYGVVESWTFLFSVEMEVLPMGFDLVCKPLVFSENGDMVLLTNDNGGIYWYDLEKKSFKRVEIHGEPSTYTATVCVGSLCLLYGDSVVAKRQ
ncbi:hypothetical protein C1H46_030860 [Malus baccata]|uniref:F-box domain-containing protein n=1 Tax=Malus baccata TaxID=106549 RepID=A0A540LAQ3_MALBA|nr:hypothetical protein C1H46_030860 [Malus baccata]